MAKEKLTDDSSGSKTQPGFFSAVEYVVPTPMELAILASSLYGKSNAESVEGAVRVAFEVWNQSFNHLDKKRESEEAILPVIAETKAQHSTRNLILDKLTELGIKFPADSETCTFSDFAKQMLPGVDNAEATITSGAEYIEAESSRFCVRELLFLQFHKRGQICCRGFDRGLRSLFHLSSASRTRRRQVGQDLPYPVVPTTSPPPPQTEASSNLR